MMSQIEALLPTPPMEPGPGSSPLLPDFAGAGATPIQLKEFYEALHLVFGQPVPCGAPSGPIGPPGPPTGPPPVGPPSVPVGPSWSVLGSGLIPAATLRPQLGVNPVTPFLPMPAPGGPSLPHPAPLP